MVLSLSERTNIRAVQLIKEEPLLAPRDLCANFSGYDSGLGCGASHATNEHGSLWASNHQPLVWETDSLFSIVPQYKNTQNALKQSYVNEVDEVDSLSCDLSAVDEREQLQLSPIHRHVHNVQTPRQLTQHHDTSARIAAGTPSWARGTRYRTDTSFSKVLTCFHMSIAHMR